MNLKKLLIFILFFPSTLFALDIQHWQLSNKTDVYFVQRTELPILDVAIIFPAGSMRDGNEFGLAALTNTLLGEGANNLSTDQIAKNFEDVGAQFQTFVDRDMAGATLRTLIDPRYLTLTLQNFSDVITTPTFPEKEMNRVRSQLMAQIQAQGEDPGDVARNEFYNLIYGNNFYAHNPLGSAQTLNAISQTDIMNFYKKYYVGANANLILVGDISLEQAKMIAEKIAGGLPEGAKAEATDTAKNLTESVMKTVPYESSQSTLMIGQVGITRQNPDYYALMVGNAILGGMSMSSILYDEIREKRGLAYVVASGFNPLEYRGPFYIYLQAKSSSIEEAHTVVTKVLQDFIANGPTDQQLAAAKKYLIGNLPFEIASNRGILLVLTNIVFYHRPLNYIDTYAQNINAVTTQAVQKAFQKNVDPNKLATVVVGSKSS